MTAQQVILSVLLKITMAFGVLAFTISMGMSVITGVSLSESLLRAGLAAGIFAAGGGLFSVILFMFFSED